VPGVARPELQSAAERGAARAASAGV
jgi:hypothetical protein